MARLIPHATRLDNFGRSRVWRAVVEFDEASGEVRGQNMLLDYRPILERQPMN